MDRAVTELGLLSGPDRAVPALRPELTFRPQVFADKTYYVIEDPLGGRFYRIGLAEYTFISLLDGRATLDDVLRATLAACPACGFTPADAAAICQWVVRMGLAQDQTVAATDPAGRAAVGPGPRRSGGRLSPLSLQLPLLHPDRLFERIGPWTGWCFSFPAFLIWCIVLAWAVRDVMISGDRLTAASSGVLALNNWFWLALAWLVLKVLHECGHAVACKRLGGEVREAGVMFVLLAPLAYVDVTSTWRLSSKWARMQVTAAGMYVELFLAALATLIWARAPLGITSHVCFNIMTTASVMTVLFNANPLMRFDGYYIISDLLELPNLYLHGQQYVTGLVRRILFGIRSPGSAGSGWRGLFVRGYGLLSWLWRSTVFASLVLTAATLLQGAGIVLSGAALIVWFCSLARRLVRLARDPRLTSLRWLRGLAVSGGMLALAGTVLWLVPWPGTVVAPAIVRFSPETIVRTQSEGFVQAIRVTNGQQVKQGDVLVVLANPEREHELATLQLAIAASQLKRRMHQQQRELAKAQAEEETLRTLESRLVEKQQQVEDLIVRAPRAGQVMSRHLPTLLGRYLERGSELLAIGNAAAKEVRLSIAQQDIDAFRARLGAPLCAYLPGRDLLQAPLTRIEPRATTLPLDAALCAPYGGPLSVHRRSDSGSATGPAAYEHLAPRFTASLSLGPAESAQVCAGQRALVAVHPYESTGAHLYQTLRQWVRSRLHRAT